MKQILTVKKKVSNVSLVCEDYVGRTFKVYSSQPMRVGQTVLVVNGLVVGRVDKQTPVVHEV